jgi:hypothetical protein
MQLDAAVFVNRARFWFSVATVLKELLLILKAGARITSNSSIVLPFAKDSIKPLWAGVLLFVFILCLRCSGSFDLYKTNLTPDSFNYLMFFITLLL